jgi:hypothetical protein
MTAIQNPQLMETMMKYGIRIGQHYVPADGSNNLLIVRDVETRR